MKQFKISFATLLTGLFILFFNVAFSQSDFHHEIKPQTTDQEIELLISDLQKQGVSLKVTKVKRLRGKIRKIEVRVNSSEGSIIYRSAPFSGLVIERDKTVSIGVRSISDDK